MNRRCIVIAAASLLIPMLLSCGSQDSVNSLANFGWYAYDAGLRQAGASEKKIFLYFRADW